MTDKQATIIANAIENGLKAVAQAIKGGLDPLVIEVTRTTIEDLSSHLGMSLTHSGDCIDSAGINVARSLDYMTQAIKDAAPMADDMEGVAAAINNAASSIDDIAKSVQNVGVVMDMQSRSKQYT